MNKQLTQEEMGILLKLARQALEDAVQRKRSLPINLDTISERLQQPGATFVTLTENGQLRGCIGALEAYLPLAEDVREHAMAAALQDYRFPPVQPGELPALSIEISYLTPPEELIFIKPEELINRLRPGVDGVIIQDGAHRATFLPQVWDKLPEPEMFLDHLCQKMGASPNLWRVKHLRVYTYQVQEFHE